MATRTLRTLRLTFMTGLCLSSQALAQPSCASRDYVVRQLTERHGESVIWLGVSNVPGNWAELYASAPDDPDPTWSFIISDGATACLIVTGKGGRTVERVPAGPET